MIVCLCTGSSERDIQRAVDGGARSLSDIGEACRAGLDCGGCRTALLGILQRGSCESCPRRNRAEAAPSLERAACL